MTVPSISIIGGDFNDAGGRSSSVVRKLTYAMEANHIFNGGHIGNLPDNLYCDLNIWMVNVSNDEKKEYPKKKAGSCLIVSKVVRNIDGEHKFFQPLARIFRMNANAVIAIEKGDTGNFLFSLIDALGNIWITTESIIKLADTILHFYNWSSKQVRQSSEQTCVTPYSKYVEDLEAFLVLVRKNAQNIMTRQGDRFFGNCSTRCMSTFPSSRFTGSSCIVSGRNSSKEGITITDMVHTWTTDTCSPIQYTGDRKPSVDTPVQLALYEALPKINYMIHGHAFYPDGTFSTTSNYCPCGDMREVQEVLDLVSSKQSDFVINLKGHGFLIGADTIDTLNGIIERYTPTMMPFRELRDI